MKNINSVVLIGRLVKDAELHEFSNGSGVIQFSICVNNQKKEEDKFVDKPCFFNAKYYGKNLSNLASYMNKGKLISIQGRLDQDKWEKDGKQNSLVLILVDQLELLGGNTQKSEEKPEYNGEGEFPEDNFPDSVPF